MSSNSTIKFQSFEASVLYFNGMYSLPVAAYPSVETEVRYQVKAYGGDVNFEHMFSSEVNRMLIARLVEFKKILLDELSEVDEIINQLDNGTYPSTIAFLTDMADWLGDIQVYCASEMTRLGIPITDTLEIIMDSNFSKLGADGVPIIKEGKVQKGPNYWKPEPKIKEMLELRIKESENG